MAFGEYFTAGRVGGQSGLGNFIREKLDVARKAGLVSHTAQAYGQANANAAIAGQKAKMDAYAPSNLSVLDQFYPIDPVTGKRDYSKVHTTDIDGRPAVTNLIVDEGMLLPQTRIGTEGDWRAPLVRPSYQTNNTQAPTSTVGMSEEDARKIMMQEAVMEFLQGF